MDKRAIDLSDIFPPGKVPPQLEQLLAALQEGKSFGEAGRLLESPQERELCKRAAMVRVFDRELFDSVLAAGLDLIEPNVQFDSLINRPGVERISRTNELYRFKDATRQEYLKAWAEQEATDDRDTFPRAQVEFSRKLVDYYQVRQKNDPDARLDLLANLILVDQSRAQTLFLSLYDEADRRFDLPPCQTLLRILEERNTALGEGLREVMYDKQRLYRTRSLFAVEYYQTISYYPRDAARRQLESLLQHPSKWIFHLYATGGLGKTQFLRWLAARHCAVDPQRIPVALLDFDFVNLPLVGRYPWLLLEPLAAQLNEQIAGRPFYEMVESPTGLREFAPLLRQMMREDQKRGIESDEESSQRKDPAWRDFYETQRKEREQAESKLQSSDAAWSQFALDRFRSALAESKLTKPGVIVFDTLEEMTITQQSALLKVLEYLAAIHEAYPGVRLILSGRYDLRERVPQFKERYGAQAECIELGRFTREEAIGYLTEKRHLADLSLLDAIYERADKGNPFKVALFADLVSSKQAAGEVLTAQDVLDFPSADFAYLIERIVERITEPEVRWALRYGVVPRRLTREFFESVMLPHLKREIGASELDRPVEKWPEQARVYEGRLIWPNQSPGDERLAVAEIWRRLRHYSSSYGWVRYHEQSDSFTFHEVRAPMRQLLRQQEIFQPLQESAVAYFDQREREALNQRAQWASEVVYHLLQFDGARALERWKKNLDSPEARLDPQARKEMAKEMLSPDFAEGMPLSRQIETTALKTAALACVALALDQNRRTAEWDEAKQLLERLKVLHPGKFVSQDALLAKIADCLTSHREGEAIPLIEELLLGKISKEIRLSLELQLADLMAARKVPAAHAHYLAALKQIGSRRSRLVPEHAIRLKLAAHYAAIERFSDAEREYSTALTAKLSEDERRGALFNLAEMHFACAQFEKSEECARQALDFRTSNTPAMRLPFHQLLARIELVCYNPIAALHQGEVTEEAQDDRALQASQSELRGAILGQLMDFEAALSLLEEAKKLWDAAGNQPAQDRCRLQMAEIVLHGVGNLKETAECLSAWRQVSQHEPSETELRLELLDVTLALRYGHVADARSKWEKLLTLDWVRTSPRLKALTIATGLALKLAAETEVKELLETLRRIELPATRLIALEPFRLWNIAAEEAFDEAWGRSGPTLKVGSRTRSDFLELFEWITPPREGQPKRGLIPRALLASDFFLWLDAQSQAMRLLALAEMEVTKQKNDFAGRAVLCARDRWEQRGRIDRARERPATAIRSEFPMLGAVIPLEHAERLYRRDEIAHAEVYLVEAGSLLYKTVPTQWSARAMELRARLLAVKGENEQALQSLRGAADTYERLDNPIAYRRLRRDIAGMIEPSRSASRPDSLFPTLSGPTRGPEEAPSQSDSIENPAYLISFDLDEGKQHFLSSDLSQHLGEKSKSKPVRVPIQIRLKDTQLLSEVFEPSFSAYNSKLRHSLTGRFVQVRREMGEFLLTAKESAAVRESNQSLDLQLSIPHGEVAALPWELALVQGEPLTGLLRSFSRTTPQTSATRATVKWVQTALNLLFKQSIFADGIYGPQTRAAVSNLQREFNLVPAKGQLDRATIAKITQAVGEGRFGAGVRALVVQSREQLQIKGDRGSSMGGMDVARIYREYNIDALTLDESRYKGLDDALLDVKPQILHLVVSMEASTRGGEISISLGGGVHSQGGRSDFVASHVNQMLKRFPDDRPRPLIILDVVAPPGITEATRQLLLRNQFATQLFHHEHTGGVIATGLAQHREQEHTLHALIRHLARGRSLGEVMNAIRGVHEDRETEEGHRYVNLMDVIATKATVLFALDPALSLIPASTQ